MFTVLACKDVEVILLTAILGGDIAFILTIGADANTKTKLNLADELLMEIPTPEIVSCSEERTFALRWHDDAFELYQNGLNGRQIMAYSGEYLHMILSVYTIDMRLPSHVAGTFLISQDEGYVLLQ